MKHVLFTILAVLSCNIAMSQNSNDKLLLDLYDYYKSKEYVRVDNSLCPIVDVVPDDDGKFSYIEIMLPSGVYRMPSLPYVNHVKNISEIENGEIFSVKKQFLTGKKIIKAKQPDPNIGQAYIGFQKNELVLILK